MHLRASYSNAETRPSGLPAVGGISWGTHLTVVRKATRAAVARGRAVELRDDDGHTLSLAALHRADPQHRAAVERLLRPTPAGTDTGVTREVARAGAPVRLAIEEIARRFGATQQHPFSGAVVVPLLAAGKIIARAQAGKAVVRVRDNGTGIVPDLLPRIFELFAQGKQGRDRAQGGLGLTIARNLAEMHGRSLRAQSDGPGKGAELTLELPLLSGRRAPAARANRAETGPTASGRKILVVDDNADAADMLAEALRMFGYVVEVVYDGPAALAIAEGFRPGIALLDIGLPAMDGLELAQRLKSLLRERPPKLIALTGYGQAADRRRSKAAGFDDHLTKPVDFQHLRIVLDRLFAAA